MSTSPSTTADLFEAIDQTGTLLTPLPSSISPLSPVQKNVAASRLPAKGPAGEGLHVPVPGEAAAAASSGVDTVGQRSALHKSTSCSCLTHTP
jgi:hypothetical protein